MQKLIQQILLILEFLLPMVLVILTFLENFLGLVPMQCTTIGKQIL